MSRQHNRVTIEPYVMHQDSLLPPRLDELIPENHLVRVVNCTRAKGNRRMRVSFRLQAFRAQALQNLLSAQGQAVRARRSTEVETVFGQIKHNMRFRRFLLRGQAKAKTEWGLLCMAHNLKKLAN